MSYEVANETDVLGQFASNSGYGELIDAVDDNYPVLQSLFKHGATEDVPGAVDELRKLDGSEDVVATSEALAELIDGEELVIITDGVSDGEEDVTKAGDGIMIAWFPPAELADKLVREGGELPEELHVTLAYLGKQEIAKDNPCHKPSGPGGGQFCETGGGGSKGYPKPNELTPGTSAPGMAAQYKNWGLISPSGVDYDGQKLNLSHKDMSKQLGFKGTDSATEAGWVRYAQFRGDRGEWDIHINPTQSAVKSVREKLVPRIDEGHTVYLDINRRGLPDSVNAYHRADGGVDFEKVLENISSKFRASGISKSLTDDQVQLLKDTVEEYCSRYAPLQGTIAGTGRFPATPSSDDKDVLVQLVDIPRLELLREELIEELADKGIPTVLNHGYTPHMTLAYVDSDYTGECVHPETYDVTVDTLTLAVGAERYVYPLNGEEVLKVEPTASQVHSDKPLTDEEKKRKQLKKSDLEAEFGETVEKSFQAEIVKVNKDKQLVFGWVTVAEEPIGKPLVDRQGDVISVDDMEKMAYDFTLNCRTAGSMHEKVGVGKLVESMVFTEEKQKALGIDLEKVGWWCGFKITDPDVWAKVKSGELPAFSIHGKGIRTKIYDEDVEKYNYCHLPAGRSDGGQFCSDAGTKASGSYAPFTPRPRSKEDSLRTSPVTSESNLGGGVSETKVITMANGDKAVFKPDSGEPKEVLRRDITPGHATEREAAAWEVAKVVGMDDMVAPAVIREVGGRRGVVIAWQDGQVAYKAGFDERYDGEKDAARAAIFDYVIGNRDRHNGNWMVRPDGRIALIDHGLAFPNNSAKYKFRNERLLDNAKQKWFDNKMLGPLSKPYLDNVGKITESLTAIGLPKNAVKLVETRISKLSSIQTWGGLH